MAVHIRLKGEQAKSQMGVKITDFLRKEEGLLVASIYQDPEKLPAHAKKTWDKLVMAADVVVECHGEN